MLQWLCRPLSGSWQVSRTLLCQQPSHSVKNWTQYLKSLQRITTGNEEEFPEPLLPVKKELINRRSATYLQPLPKNLKYNPRMYDGGLLPRLKDSKPVKLPEHEPLDSWHPKKALFGQNDYIG